MKRKYTSLMAACLMASMISTPILAADLTPAETSITEAGNINLPSSFTDSKLYDAVKAALADKGVTITSYGNVSQADLDKITTLDVHSKQISTLRGITVGKYRDNYDIPSKMHLLHRGSDLLYTHCRAFTY
ncbi:hypothetical protein IM774_10370 [Erysipelotrichaceae bacterium RD49]|nr:hypothetical protein [Erysipelotrichaceae bacterium RD49]